MKKIIFSKEMFIKDSGIVEYLDCKGWVDEIDGVEVDMFNHDTGFAQGFLVHIDWCEITEVNHEYSTLS